MPRKSNLPPYKREAILDSWAGGETMAAIA